MKLKNHIYTLVISVSVIFGWSCTSHSEEGKDHKSIDGTSVTVQAEDYTDKSGEVIIAGDLVEHKSGYSTLSFEVNVPESGRYAITVSAKGRGSLWVEDYYDNPDDRTYNVTGEISLESNELVALQKHGSPLKKGIHKMMVHINGEEISMDKFDLTLMRRHETTPKTHTQKMDGDKWSLVWSDEFDQEGAPDTTKWTYDVGNWGWGNNEPQYYTVDRRENARIENGALIIEARRNDMGHAWTSARLTTRGKESFLYGKIEFRAKAPSSDGTWAAGWLLGDSYEDELSWPYCGEVDVLECVGSEIDDVTGNGINHGSCHTRTYYFKENTHITNTIEIEDMTNKFHTYSIEWNSREIKAFVDGKHYYTYDKNKDELEWPFNKPQNLIVNLAMGGGMGGDIDPAVDSAKFIIDYIRVYELN